MSDFNFEKKMGKKGEKLIAAGKLKLGIIPFNFKHTYKYSNNRNAVYLFMNTNTNTVIGLRTNVRARK